MSDGTVKDPERIQSDRDRVLAAMPGYKPRRWFTFARVTDDRLSVAITLAYRAVFGDAAAYSHERLAPTVRGPGFPLLWGDQ